MKTCGSLPSTETPGDFQNQLEEDIASIHSAEDIMNPNESEYSEDCLLELCQLKNNFGKTNVQTPIISITPKSNSHCDSQQFGLFTNTDFSDNYSSQLSSSSSSSSLHSKDRCSTVPVFSRLSKPESSLLFSTVHPNPTPLALRDNDQDLMKMSWDQIHSKFRDKYGLNSTTILPEQADIDVLERMEIMRHPDKDHTVMLEWGKSFHNRSLSGYLMHTDIDVGRSAQDRTVRADADMEEAVMRSAKQSGSDLVINTQRNRKLPSRPIAGKKKS